MPRPRRGQCAIRPTIDNPMRLSVRSQRPAAPSASVPSPARDERLRWRGARLAARRLQPRSPAARARRRDLGRGPDAGDRATRARRADPRRAARGRRRASSRRRRSRDEAVDAVHERALLDYLAGAWERLGGAGLTEDPGQDRVVPYLFPHPGLLDGFAPARPAAATRPRRPLRLRHDDPDRPGHLGGGAWRGRRGADRGRPRRRRASPPPTRAAARRATTRRAPASAAPATSTTPPRRPRACAPGSSGPVAVLDIDAHHGNGTQADLLRGLRRSSPARFTSIRAAGGSPTSSASTTRPAPGRRGTNRNLCLGPGAGDDAWLAAVDRARRLGAGRRGGGARCARSASSRPAATRRAPRRQRRRLSPRRPRARRARPADRGRPGGRLRPGDDRRARRREALAGFEAGLDVAQA